MCEHLTGGYHLEDWIEERCPWCEIDKLEKQIKELEQKSEKEFQDRLESYCLYSCKIGER